jgi:hypothetical protein
MFLYQDKQQNWLVVAVIYTWLLRNSELAGPWCLLFAVCVSTHYNWPWHWPSVSLKEFSVVSFNKKDTTFNHLIRKHTEATVWKSLSYKYKVLFEKHCHVCGARGSVIGWYSILQAGRSQDLFQMRSLDFFSLPNSSSHTMALGSTQFLTEMSTRDLPGG